MISKYSLVSDILAESDPITLKRKLETFSPNIVTIIEVAIANTTDWAINSEALLIFFFKNVGLRIYASKSEEQGIDGQTLTQDVNQQDAVSDFGVRNVHLQKLRCAIKLHMPEKKNADWNASPCNSLQCRDRMWCVDQTSVLLVIQWLLAVVLSRHT